MLTALKEYFSPSPLKQHAYDAYVQIVAQARQPVFYHEWQVEDTIDGRFDVIVLHMFLLLSRLRQDDDQLFSRYLSEAFFSDMDRSLREMGASDTGVGMRVKKMAQAFYGRMKVYEEAIVDETLLAETLKRNVYREKPVQPEIVASLASYMLRNYRALQRQSLENRYQGAVAFLS